MEDATPGAGGLMVQHLWTEPGHRMRVRITRTTDLPSGVSTTSYASTKTEVRDAVGRWLDSLVTLP